MKIFAIRDEDNAIKNDLAYLIYYEHAKRFYIEIPEDADPWETPLLLETFVKRGEKTINAYWSRLWVQQRIIPTDRQNLGQILKENGLESYDEFELLMLAEGRCAQDNYYLVPVSESDLPGEFMERHQRKVEDVIPLDEAHLLVFFRNGEIKKCNMAHLVADNSRFRPIINNSQLFCTVGVQVGGYGISWGEDMDVTDKLLYDNGVDVPLTINDFINFTSYRVVDTSEATDILECSRQNIDDLTRREKLHPIKVTAKNKLFLKSEILQRRW